MLLLLFQGCRGIKGQQHKVVPSFLRYSNDLPPPPRRWEPIKSSRYFIRGYVYFSSRLGIKPSNLCTTFTRLQTYIYSLFIQLSEGRRYSVERIAARGLAESSVDIYVHFKLKTEAFLKGYRLSKTNKHRLSRITWICLPMVRH